MLTNNDEVIVLVELLSILNLLFRVHLGDNVCQDRVYGWLRPGKDFFVFFLSFSTLSIILFSSFSPFLSRLDLQLRSNGNNELGNK